MVFSCLLSPHEGWTGTFYTQICPARRKTVQPEGATP
nr:MAG TPA: hypothetical protein [Caudoviricetes sp.]